MSANLNEIIARSLEGKATIEDGYHILNAMQAESDRLQEMIDDLSPANLSIPVVIRGENYTFENVDQMSKWITEELE